jgi:hypothetical protein
MRTSRLSGIAAFFGTAMLLSNGSRSKGRQAATGRSTCMPKTPCNRARSTRPCSIR